MKYRVGIDIGGTNVRVGKLNENGEVFDLVVKPSNGISEENNLMETIYQMLDEYDLSDALGIGVGIAGSVDSVNKCLQSATNLVGCENLPIGKLLEDRYHLPVEVENDANVAGLAEATYGSGKGCKVVYYITHSTGIGGALVVNGKVIKGRSNNAGEIGSFVLVSEPKTRIERLDAGPGILQKAKERIGEHITSTREVFDLFKQNNPIATEIIDEMCRDMGVMLANICFVLDPDCFVFGGGVTKSFSDYYPIMKKYYDFYSWGEMRDTPIVLASLEEPGVVGAALLIK